MTATLRFLTAALFSALILFAGCGTAPESDEKEAAKQAITETPFDILLTAKWADLGRDNAFIEEWERSKDGLRGTGVVLSQGDTVFIEHLQLVQRDSIWYYTARTDGQNNGEPVFFECTMIDPELGLFLFENPDHDFPQSIGYQFRASGELHIKTHGYDADTIRTEIFNMWPWDGEI